MITVLGTDITIFVIFAVGFFIGRLQGQNRRLRLDNAKLQNQSKLSNLPKPYQPEAGH